MPGGRPSKFIDKYKDAIVERVEKGSKYKPACILADVSYSLFMDWKLKGQADKEKGKKTEYTEFLDRITLAREKYIAGLEDSVNKTAQEDGKFALELLSRIRPDVYGKKDKLNVSGKIENEVEGTIEIRIVTDGDEFIK